MIPAGVYLRVSSTDGRQDEANQRPDCERLCAARSWAPLFFTERQSAAKDRPEWRRLLEACRRGEVRAVVFWALDRAGRNRVQIAHDLGELARYGVHVASVQDAWLDQPPGPLRDLLVQIMGWVAEGERARLIERTKAGQARARAEGRHPGRPPANDNDLAAAAKAVRAGASVAFAARAVGIGRTTLRRWLAKNPPTNAPGQPTRIRGL